jgi:hypothetical protein
LSKTTSGRRAPLRGFAKRQHFFAFSQMSIPVSWR